MPAPDQRAATEVLPWIPVRGDSMWPALRSQDRARIDALSAPPVPGDVVVIRAGAAFTIHRVVSVSEDGVVRARGDNCAFMDAPAPLSCVAGVVRVIERGGRRLERAEWDVGPSQWGRVRLHLKRAFGASMRRLG